MTTETSLDVPFNQSQMQDFEQKWEKLHQIIALYQVQSIDSFTMFKGQVSRQKYMQLSQLIYQLTLFNNGLYFELIHRKFCGYMQSMVTRLENQDADTLHPQLKIKRINKMWRIYLDYYSILSHIFRHLFGNNILTQQYKQACNINHLAMAEFIRKIVLKRIDDLDNSFMDHLNQIRLNNHKILDKAQLIDIDLDEIATQLQPLKQFVCITKQWSKIQNDVFIIRKLRTCFVQNTNLFYYSLMKQILTAKSYKSSMLLKQSVYLKYVKILAVVEHKIIEVTNIMSEDQFKINFKEQFVISTPQNIVENFNIKLLLTHKNINQIKAIHELYQNFHCCQKLMVSYKSYLNDEIDNFIKNNDSAKQYNIKKIEMSPIEKWMYQELNGQIFFSSLIMFHRSLLGFINASFDKSVLFVSTYITTMTQKLRISVKKYRLDRVLVKHWNRDLHNVKIKQTHIISMAKTYIELFRIFQLDQNILYNSMSLGLINRLETNQSDEQLQKQSIVLGIMKDNSIVNEKMMWGIWDFYSKRKISDEVQGKRQDFQQIKEQKIKVSIIKNAYFRGTYSSATNTLSPKLNSTIKSFCEKHSFSQISFLHEIDSMIWEYKIRNSINVTVKGNAVQAMIFFHLYEKDNGRISIEQYEKFKTECLIDNDLMMGNLIIMIKRGLIRLEQQKQEDKIICWIAVDFDLKVEKDKCIELSNFFRSKLVKYEQEMTHPWVLEGMLIKILKKEGEMNISRLISQVLNHSNTFNTIQNVKSIIYGLVKKAFIRLDEDIVVYLP